MGWTETAIEYAESASLKKNKYKFGKWIRLACDRFLKDLSSAKKKERFIYSPQHSDAVCDFISNLPHVEGSWETENIKLEPFQVFFLCNLFGFRNFDGNRRFTTALYATSRKSSKSTLAAAIGNYCLTVEKDAGPQIISAATTGGQAGIVFGIAKRQAEKSKDFRDAFDLEVFTRSIANYSNGGFFRPINSKASTQDGLNPSCLILDEIHAHKSSDLLNVLQSAAGARRNPLFLFTTTEGYESPGPWPELRKFAQQVLDGVVSADHFLALYYAIDDEDDEFDERVWVKANPLIEANPLLLDAIRKEAKEAKSMPGRHPEFLIKRMNRPTSTSKGWIDLNKWRSCAGEIDLEWLKDYPCYGALDLASSRDLVSFRLVWIIENKIYTYGWRFCPSVAIDHRKVRNLVPYYAWARSGHIIETKGEVTDYDVVFDKIFEVSQKFKLIKVAYDQWNASQIALKMKNNNIESECFIQGPKSYHPAMKYFEEAYFDKRFIHNNDPVLTWCASNVIARTDQNMNLAPDRKNSADKIDDIVALLMAVGIAVKDNEQPQNNLDDFLNNPLTF
jgi:phage terminase large subunit-like protein